MKKIFIGCSGWRYYDWKNIFYPEDMKSKDYFSYYCKYFNTVELNFTFYHLSRKSTFKKLYLNSPKDFIFSVKANKIITHVKKLKNCEEELREIFHNANELKEKFGCMLFQLPPSLKYNLDLLKDFLKMLRKITNKNCALEFRHESWFNDNTYKLLREYDIAICDVSSPKLSFIPIVTAEYIYIRLHGKDKWYDYDYSDEELSEIKKFVENNKNKMVFIYFNNTIRGNAVKNALKLKEMLKS